MFGFLLFGSNTLNMVFTYIFMATKSLQDEKIDLTYGSLLLSIVKFFPFLLPKN